MVVVSKMIGYSVIACLIRIMMCKECVECLVEYEGTDEIQFYQWFCARLKMYGWWHIHENLDFCEHFMLGVECVQDWAHDEFVMDCLEEWSIDS
jgi:hypothetical protein